MQTRPFFIWTTYNMVTFKTLPVRTLLSGETLLSRLYFSPSLQGNSSIMARETSREKTRFSRLLKMESLLAGYRCPAGPVFNPQRRELSVTEASPMSLEVPSESNRPFPSSPGPLYRKQVKCLTFDMEMIFHFHANETHFHKEGRAPGLILKVRVFFKLIEANNL